MSKQSELKSLLETVFVVIGTLVGAVLIITFATSKSDPEDKPEPEAKNIPLEQMVQPFAKVKLAIKNTAQDNESISGEKISQVNCIMCHTSGLMGAPKIGNMEQWKPRIAKGKKLLVSNAVNGIRQMPARGGNASLSDGEIAAAVIWMTNKSGGSL